MQQGISPLLSYLIMIGIGLSTISIVVAVGLPVLNTYQETASIDQAIQTLTAVDDRIDSVVYGGRGTTRSASLDVDQGGYVLDEDKNEIRFEISSKSNIIATQASRDIGPVNLAANADVLVEERILNGTACYWMENKYLEACVRKISEEYEAPSHLVGYWRMNEGDGQWANDSSRYGNNAKLGGSLSNQSNDPSWSSSDSVEGNAMEFDGSDDYIDSGSAFLNHPSEFTLSGWINVENLDSQRDLFGQNNVIEFFLLSDNMLRLWTSGDGSIEYNYTDFVGEWHHITGTGTGNELRLYIDGELKESGGSSSSDYGSSGYTVKIGAGVQSPSGGNFYGKLDDVRIYNRSLAQRDIQYLYNQKGALNYINTSQLLVHYRNHKENIEPNMNLSVEIDEIKNTSFGTGFTQPEKTGTDLGRGRVTAEIDSEYGFLYQVNFDLLSGADFLKVSIE